jgi:Xaa-Pro aminopeptidase
MTQTRKTPPEPYSLRINKLRAEMDRRKLDGYLIQNRLDQYWLTGFTGEDGAVLVTPQTVVLLTDGRFQDTADLEAPYARKVVRKKRSPEETVAELRRGKVRRLGFDPDHMNVREFTAFRKLASPTRLVAASDMIAPLRAIKDASEVELLRQAVRVAEQAFNEVRAWLRPGLSEREIAAELAYRMRRLGAQGESFPAIVAVGSNAAIPHYEPGDRKLAENEVLLVDWGAKVSWYGSDLTRVLWLGTIPPRLRQVFDIVREAADRAIDAVKPGIKASAVDRVARELIRKSGYGKHFTHGLGHGLGLGGHEGPRFGKRSKDVLKPGMAVTIEPGIYLPGEGGVRIEHDVLVTETGHELLSTLPAELA